MSSGNIVTKVGLMKNFPTWNPWIKKTHISLFDFSNGITWRFDNGYLFSYIPKELINKNKPKQKNNSKPLSCVVVLLHVLFSFSCTLFYEIAMTRVLVKNIFGILFS